MSYRPINWRSVAPNWVSGVISNAISDAASAVKAGTETELEPLIFQAEEKIKAEPADSLQGSAEASIAEQFDADTTGNVPATTAASPALLPLDEPLKIPAIPALNEKWQAWEPHLEALRDRDWFQTEVVG